MMVLVMALTVVMGMTRTTARAASAARGRPGVFTVICHHRARILIAHVVKVGLPFRGRSSIPSAQAWNNLSGRLE